MRNAPLPAALALLLLGALTAPVAYADPDPEIEGYLQKIFEGRPDENFVSIVISDDPRAQYLAFHISTYLDVRELRVYVVPYNSTDADAINTALAADDHDKAFELLLSGMRLDLGAKYVSDAGLNGINDKPVPLGTGALRDNFHRDQFASYAEADEAYRRWLRRGVQLRES